MFRKNDIVMIKATVTAPLNEDAYGCLKGRIGIKPMSHHDNIYVDVDQIELVTPFFSKGDQVKTPHSNHAQVIGTFDDFVWVREGNGDLVTYEAKELQYVATS